MTGINFHEASERDESRETIALGGSNQQIVDRFDNECRNLIEGMKSLRNIMPEDRSELCPLSGFRGPLTKLVFELSVDPGEVGVGEKVMRIKEVGEGLESDLIIFSGS